MIYVNKSIVIKQLFLLSFSLIITSCGIRKTTVFNQGSYEVEVSGSQRKPGLLLFVDHSCVQNDSITKFLSRSYSVYVAERKFSTVIEQLNGDNYTSREKDGFELFLQLKSSHAITHVGATGFEAYTIANWISAVEPQSIYLYPYATGSIKDHLLGQISVTEPWFELEFGSAIDIYSLLENPYSNNGFIHEYPLLYLSQIWEFRPDQLLSGFKNPKEIHPLH